MKVNLEQLKEFLAQKTSIKEDKITVKAWFPYDGDPVSKDDLNNRLHLCGEYGALFECQKVLYVDLYNKDQLLLELEVKGASPKDNDLYEIMEIRNRQESVGPGFYYNYPYFYINGAEAKDKIQKQNYTKFLKSAYISTKKAEISDSSIDLTNWDELESYLASLGFVN